MEVASSTTFLSNLAASQAEVNVTGEHLIHNDAELIKTLKFVATLMYRAVPPVLIAFGTIGNVLSILVLRRPEIGNMPSKPYLIGLALADIFSLNVPLLRQWLAVTFRFDLRTIHVIGCKVNSYVSYVAMFSSVWFLVGVSLDRLVCVVVPLKSRYIRPKHRIYFMALIVAVFALVSGHILFFLRLVPSPVTGLLYCYSDDPSYKYFFSYFWSWVDLLFTCAIPFSIMIVASVVMVSKLNVERQSMDDSRNIKKNYKSTTRLLVSLNLVFILTNSPKRIYWLSRPYLNIQTGLGYAIRDVISALVYVILYVNNAVNFLLYITLGPMFRKALRALFTCRPAAR